MANLQVAPCANLLGEITIPGDKSITHRAVILGSIAQGMTRVRGFLPSEDCLHTIQAMRDLGVAITESSPHEIVIEGVGLHGLQAPTQAIECGNSGTSMRILAGLLAAQPFASVLQGDASLQRRPMERIVKPLQLMGARIEGCFPPLTMQSTEKLTGLRYELPIASAQVKSCLLVAGLYANDQMILTEPQQTRDHTERMLAVLGADITVQGRTICLNPGKELSAKDLLIPGDISSAAFFICAASMKPGCHIVIRGVGINPTRMGVIAILQQMGADITLHSREHEGNEPIADIEVRGKELHGMVIPPEWVVSAMDEFPILFIVAAAAKGETVLRGAQELRVKESDRIAVMAKGLQALGGQLDVLPDGIIIRGSALRGGEVDSEGDHRVAMAFAMASLLADQTIQINQSENIATSFPNFCELAAQLGLNIRGYCQ